MSVSPYDPTLLSFRQKVRSQLLSKGKQLNQRIYHGIMNYLDACVIWNTQIFQYFSRNSEQRTALKMTTQFAYQQIDYKYSDSFHEFSNRRSVYSRSVSPSQSQDSNFYPSLKLFKDDGNLTSKLSVIPWILFPNGKLIPFSQYQQDNYTNQQAKKSKFVIPQRQVLKLIDLYNNWKIDQQMDPNDVSSIELSENSQLVQGINIRSFVGDQAGNQIYRPKSQIIPRSKKTDDIIVFQPPNQASRQVIKKPVQNLPIVPKNSNIKVGTLGDFKKWLDELNNVDKLRYQSQFQAWKRQINLWTNKIYTKDVTEQQVIQKIKAAYPFFQFGNFIFRPQDFIPKNMAIDATIKKTDYATQYEEIGKKIEKIRQNSEIMSKMEQYASKAFGIDEIADMNYQALDRVVDLDRKIDDMLRQYHGLGQYIGEQYNQILKIFQQNQYLVRTQPQWRLNAFHALQNYEKLVDKYFSQAFVLQQKTNQLVRLGAFSNAQINNLKGGEYQFIHPDKNAKVIENSLDMYKSFLQDNRIFQQTDLDIFKSFLQDKGNFGKNNFDKQMIPKQVLNNKNSKQVQNKSISYSSGKTQNSFYVSLNNMEDQINQGDELAQLWGIKL